MLPPAAFAGRRLAASTTLIWLVTAIIMVALCWSRYAGPDFRDPDEAMRLAQVRDFLAGQSWFDVSQHRVNPPVGGPMHWSRLVDVPIAGLILLFRPFVGTGLAERIAMVLEPLLLLGALFGVFVGAARRIAGRETALVSALLLALSLSILFQFLPLRIDHHNWQILMAAVLLWAAFDPDVRRGGLIAGGAMALWLHISSEGLPYAAIFGGLFALRFVGDPTEWPRLSRYLVGLTLLSALLLVATHGAAASLVAYCDAMSPTYLAPLIVAAAVLPAARMFIGDGSAAARLAIPALAGIAAGGTFILSGRACLAGPFETLDPLVYRYWYLRVQEGRPIWDQASAIAGMILIPALLGLIGTIIALVRAQSPSERNRWLAMLMLSLAAFAVAVMVMRAMSVAHLIALPGNAVLLRLLYDRARAFISTPLRIVATVMLLLATPLGLASVWSALSPDGNASAGNGTFDVDSGKCGSPPGLRTLAALPVGTVLAPLDIGPNILVFTKDSVLGTGHHRNIIGMATVIRTFMGTPEYAHQVLLTTPARYLAYCPGLRELGNYAQANPASLAAVMERGQVPSWLTPLPRAKGDVLRLYRIERPAER
jgi:hypothetical protein